VAPLKVEKNDQLGSVFNWFLKQGENYQKGENICNFPRGEYIDQNQRET
jgi:hypothetical protein